MRVITRNAIRCKKCGDVIESESVHDYQECSCGACFVDGGHEYVRFGGDLENIEPLTEYGDKPGYYITHYTRHGGVTTFETADDYHNYVELYEDMWDYVKVTDEDKNLIYETDGLDDFRKRHRIEN